MRWEWENLLCVCMCAQGGISEKVAFGYGLEGSEGVSHLEIWWKKEQHVQRP